MHLFCFCGREEETVSRIFSFYLFCPMKSCRMKLFLFECCLRTKLLSQNKKRRNENATVRMIEMIFKKKIQVAASLSTEKVELLLTVCSFTLWRIRCTNLSNALCLLIALLFIFALSPP